MLLFLLYLQGYDGRTFPCFSWKILKYFQDFIKCKVVYGILASGPQRVKLISVFHGWTLRA